MNIKSAVIIASAMFITSAMAAPKQPAALSDTQVDAVVKKLEDSGALDRALERAIQRYQARAAQQQREQAEAEAQKAARLAVNARKPDPAIDHVRGNPDAIISLIEYSDVECPFCKNFQQTPGALVAKFNGQVSWIWRHFPLSFHEPMASKEAVAAECANKLGGPQSYWNFIDKMIATTRSNGQGIPGDNPLQTLAKAEGLNVESFNACLSDNSMSARIQLDMADGTKAGVSGTPTTLIRNNRTGEVLVSVGFSPEEAIAANIQQLLGSKAAAK